MKKIYILKLIIIKFINRSSSFQCQRIFQVSAPVNCVCLHPNQAELMVGDQSGVIHLWDLRSDHNEQLVFIFYIQKFNIYIFLKFSLKLGILRKAGFFIIAFCNLFIILCKNVYIIYKKS